MGIIETRIKETFDEYRKSNHLNKLVHEIVNIADYSVHSRDNAEIMYAAIKKYCPIPVYECVYYDGEAGVYRLLDFNPNGLDRETLLLKIESHLVQDCYINSDEVDKAMENVYLLNINTLKKVG